MPRKRSPQTTKATEGVCGYCMGRIANQMVRLTTGTRNGHTPRRWMCQPCIELRGNLVKVCKGNFVRAA